MRELRVKAMVKIAEFIGHWAGTYEAGADVFNSAMARCIIIGERIEAQQKPNEPGVRLV